MAKNPSINNECAQRILQSLNRVSTNAALQKNLLNIDNLTKTNMQQLLLVQNSEDNAEHASASMSSVSDSESDSGSEFSPNSDELSS